MTGTGTLKIGAFDPDAWAGLVLSDRPGRGFAFRLAIEKGGRRADGVDLLYLVHEVGPHAPDGRYARVAFDTDLPFCRGEDTPIVRKADPSAGLTVEWSRSRDGALLRASVIAQTPTGSGRGKAVSTCYRYYRSRRPQDEPEERRPSGPERRQRARGPRRSAPFTGGSVPTPERLVVVTADADEVAAARTMIPYGPRLTIIEPAAIFTEDYFAELLFERESGKRRVETLVLGASALAADRRSLKPSWFWELPEVVAALRRFQAAGGQVVRPAAQ